MDVSFDVSGLAELQDVMVRLDSALQAQVHGYLLQWADAVKAMAEQLVPVRTGYLKSTIYATVKDWVADIGAKATYAVFVEQGTRYMKAQPFLYPALAAYLPQLEQIILAAIDAATSEAGLQ
jgi:HK97 gp10 family phage protein